MNFNLADTQAMLQDSVARFVTDHYTLEARMAEAGSRDGFSAEHWQQMADLGWLGVAAPTESGGFGGSQIDTMIIMEQFGKGLVCVPYLPTVVLGLDILTAATPAKRFEQLIGEVIAGSIHLALAYVEPQAGFDLHDVALHAEAVGDDYRLHGAKSMVFNAGTADHLIVSARTAGPQRSEDGITLFLVPADAPGVKIARFPTTDGLQAAEVTLEDVEVGSTAMLSGLDEGFPLLESAIHNGILAICAEAVGAMEILYKDTVDYTQQREQFDRPLTDFQVVKHRLVDMFMEYEQCKSLLYRATLEACNADVEPAVAARTLHALKYLVGKSGVMIGENAVQLHGGMGMTEELRIGHYFKRLLVIDAQFGNSDYHLERFAAR